MEHEFAAGLVSPGGGPLDASLAVQDHASLVHLTFTPAVPAVVQQGHGAPEPSSDVVRPRNSVVPRSRVAVELQEVDLRVLAVRLVHRGDREVVSADGHAVLGAHGELLDVAVRWGQGGRRRGMFRRGEVLQLALEDEHHGAYADVADGGSLCDAGGESHEDAAEPAEHRGVRGGSRRWGGRDHDGRREMPKPLCGAERTAPVIWSSDASGEPANDGA